MDENTLIDIRKSIRTTEVIEEKTNHADEKVVAAYLIRRLKAKFIKEKYGQPKEL